MGAAFHQSTVIHHQNLIRSGNGGQSMGNHKAGAPLHQLQHGFLNQLFRAGIHVGGGFIQNQHGGIHEHGSGNGQQLLLPLGNAGAGGNHRGIVALGHGLNHIVNVGSFCSLNHFLTGGIRAAVGNVLVHRAFK